MKKILVLLLTVVMLFTLGTITAFATDTTEETTNVAKIGEAEYATLPEAFANASDCDTITLIANVDLATSESNGAFVIQSEDERELTLDLNGYNITAGARSGYEARTQYAFDNYDNLTIIGSGTITSRGIQNYGTLTIDSANVTVIACDTNGGACVWAYEGSTTYINGGSFYGKNSASLIFTSGKAVITDGTFTQENDNVKQYAYALQFFGTEATISNATVYAAHGAIYAGAGTVTVNGGYYECTGMEGATDNCVYVDSSATLLIESGAFVGDADKASGGASLSVDGNATVNGGSFSGGSGSDVYASSSTVINGGSFEALDSSAASAISTGAVVTVAGETVVKNEDGTTAACVAKIGDTAYATFDEAITAANGMTGDVVIEIYGKVEYSSSTANLTGSYDTLSFVGKTDDAEISITRNGAGGYITGNGNDVIVNLEDLILSKPTGSYATDAGYMNVYFTVYRVGGVNYTNCTFPDGACAQGCPVTYKECNFANQASGEYSLWVYASTTVTVDNCEFTGVRGVKMYTESHLQSDAADITITNTTFPKATEKPAIVLTYGASVTLENNEYPTTIKSKEYSGSVVFELDKDGNPDGTTVKIDKTEGVVCITENEAKETVACGVLVNNTIYTSISNAATVAQKGDTVTLMYSTTEAVELPEGVTLNTNGNTAENVTVVESIAYVATYDELVKALADEKESIILTADIVAPDKATLTIKNTTLDLNGFSLTLNGESGRLENSTIKNGTIEITTYEGDTVADGMFDVYGDVSYVENVKFHSAAFALYAIFDLKSGNLEMTDCIIDMANNTVGGNGGLFFTNGGDTLTMTRCTVTGTDIGDFISNGTAILNNCEITLKGTVEDGLDNGINGAALTLNNTSLTVDGATGRGITTDGDAIAINGTSSVVLTNCAEGGVRYKASATITVEETASLSATVKVDSAATNATVNKTVIAATSSVLPTLTVENGLVTVEEKVDLNDVFTFKGYSKNENGAGITATYIINHEKLAAYERQNGVTVEFGAVFAIGVINERAIEYSLSRLAKTTTYNIKINDIDENSYGVALVLTMYVDLGQGKQYVTGGADNTTVFVDSASVPTVTYNPASGTSTTEEEEQ